MSCRSKTGMKKKYIKMNQKQAPFSDISAPAPALPHSGIKTTRIFT